MGWIAFWALTSRDGRTPLIIESSQFCTADLNQALEPVGAFDLAVCVEVAEHLRKHAAPTLVDALTLAAPVVLFSAATPGQGGHGHLNERPRAFWHALFGARNFVSIDCLRPQIWQNKQVASWSRQNLSSTRVPRGFAGTRSSRRRKRRSARRT